MYTQEISDKMASSLAFQKEDDLVTPWFVGPNPLRVTGYKQEYCTK